MANFKIYKNRSMHFCASSDSLRDTNVTHFVSSKVGQGHRNFRYEVIRWQISKSTRVVPCIFAPAITVSDINVSNV